jgi:hypothetical protein
VFDRVPEPAAGPGALPVSRRTALAGLAGATVGLVTGCTSDGPEPGDADAGPSSTPTGTRSPAVEPDVRLAATVLDAEQAMLDRLVATGRRHRRLQGRLAVARAAHRDHVELLASAVPPGATRTPAPRRRPAVPRSPAEALAALARAEDRLARTGRQSALVAESGAFARALAAMAASAAQLAVTTAPAASDGIGR